MFHSLARHCLATQRRRTLNLLSRRSLSSYEYSPLFQSNIYNEVEEYRQLADSSAVETLEVNGQEYLQVHPEAMTLLSEQAFGDIAHLLRLT